MSQPAPTPTTPAPYVVGPQVLPHTHTVILFHGRTHNGAAFGKGMLEEALTSQRTTIASILPHAKFIFPTAPMRQSVALGQGMLRQWFDVPEFQYRSERSERSECQLPGMKETAREIRQLLQEEQEKHQIPARNILIGGMSQGCAISLSLLLALDYSIGGFIGLSGYLPFQANLDRYLTGSGGREEGAGEREDPAVLAATFQRELLDLQTGAGARAGTASSTPIFLAHGDADVTVPLALAEAMVATLRKAGFRVEFKVYRGLMHECRVPDEFDDVERFLRHTLSWDQTSL